MPRSAMMITKSLRLNLKLVYQLTQRMMICPSKCRPLNSASIGPKGRILPSSAIGSVCTRAVYTKLRLWIDSNHDGIAQAGELHTLQELQVESISLNYRESRRTD